MFNAGTFFTWLSSIDWGMVSGLAALLAALAAAFALIQQGRLTRYSIAVETLGRLEDRFDSDRMTSRRRLAAVGLIGKGNPEDVEYVLDFFESVALLSRRKALDLEMIWSSFGPFLEAYWVASTSHVANLRQNDPTLWTYTEALYNAVMTLDAKKRSKQRSNMLVNAALTDDMRHLLQSEAELT